MKLQFNLVIVIGLVLAASGCGDGPTARPGNQAPRFSLRTLDGTTVNNDTLKGQIVLLSFWSTTCSPCVREIPHLQQIEASSKAKVIGIALDPGGAKTVQRFVEKHRIKYSVAVGDEELFQRFDGYALPYSLLLDRSHRVVKIYRGAVTRQAVERDIQGLPTGL